MSIEIDNPKAYAFFIVKFKPTFEENEYDPSEPRLPPLQKMTGYAMVWSVLEFVFCLKEVHRHEETDPTTGSTKAGAFAAYGEGVFIAAATLICITNQRPLYYVLSIGDKIRQQNMTDIAILVDENMSRFLDIYQLVESSLSFSLMTVQPAVQSVISIK